MVELLKKEQQTQSGLRKPITQARITDGLLQMGRIESVSVCFLITARYSLHRPTRASAGIGGRFVSVGNRGLPE